MTWPSVWVLREDVTFIRYKSSTCLCLARCLWPFSALSVTYSRVKGITQMPQDSRCWNSQSAIPLVFLKCSSGWDELGCHILTHICACFSSNNQIPTNELIYSVQWMFLVLKIQTSLPGSPWNILTGCCLSGCQTWFWCGGATPLSQRNPTKSFLSWLCTQGWAKIGKLRFSCWCLFQPARDEFHWKPCEGLCSLLQSRALFYPLVLPFNRL